MSTTGRKKGGEKTGGRKRGQPNKLTARTLDVFKNIHQYREAKDAGKIDSGEVEWDPLAEMILDAWDRPADERDKLLKEIANYKHSKLSTTTVQGPDGGPPKIQIVKYADDK